MKRIFWLGLPLFLPTVSFAGMVHTPHVDAELIAENQSIEPGKKFWVALHLQMEKHWHTYWQNPGDSGLPTKIQWSLPEGFTAGPINWPAPSKIELAPLVNYGYSGEVLLLTEISAPENLKNTQKISLEAMASWLVCKESCIPGKAKLHLDLPVLSELPKPNPWVGAFLEARKEFPIDLPGIARAELSGAQIVLTIPEELVHEREKPVFFPLDPDLIAGLSEPVLSRKNGELNFTFRKADPFDKKMRALRGQLVIGKDANARSYKINSPFEGMAKEESFSFSTLLLAFFGGILLNLMPCVFPVLGIKILGVVKQHGAKQRSVRMQGLFYALGVLCSFWFLAALLLVLRSAGEELGWGFQLQSPSFVAAVSILLFAVALNFLGALEFSGSFMGAGANLAAKEGGIGAFFTGVLAVVVATPCSAPFMGTAIGAALVAPPVLGLLIFTFLALGLAAPYLVLSFYPSLLAFLPKPGAWMLQLKEFFAFPIFATVLWLVWVYAQQLGIDSALLLCGAFLLVALAAWIYGKWKASLWRSCCLLAILMFTLLLAFVFAPRMGKNAVRTSIVDEELDWKPYSAKALSNAVSSGSGVFLDFTAAWCLSCKVNERLVLANKEVKEAFRAAHIELLRGDWTKRDPEITRFLESIGRAGVPVYIYYAPGKGSEPKILSQILSTREVLSTIRVNKK